MVCLYKIAAAALRRPRQIPKSPATKGAPMKKITQRLLSALCAGALAASLLPSAPALAADTLSFSDTYDIANGLRYTAASSQTGDLRQQSFRLDYTPGKDIAPIVAYGNKLYGKSDINEIIDFVQRQGQSVYGAANADFFVMSTGLPSGLVVNNGRLVSSDGMWNAVGVKPDGKMIVGAPQMAMSLYSTVTGDYPVYAFNKLRANSGIYLLNSDFSTQTHSAGEGVVVRLTPVDSEPLRIGRDKQFTVTAVDSAVSGSTPINEGEFILTSSKAYNNRGYTIDSLQVGETVTFRANVYNEAFADVVYACGAGDMVMKNGVMQSGLSTSREPRTLLGVRDDGSATALVHDGRLEISRGVSLKDAAQLLANKGCTNIVNLDGGGSSAEAVRQPGSAKTEVVNIPSEGSLRKCANYLMFVNIAPKTGEEAGSFVFPHNAATLKGAKITMGANTFDQHYYPVSSYQSGFVVAGPDGQTQPLEGAVFTAPDQAGEYKISLDNPAALSMPAVIAVYAQPDRVMIKRNGAEVSTLALDMGETVDLDIDAFAQSRILYEQDELFTWEVTGNAGTITQAGVFTASSTAGASGEIVVTHNGFSARIPVSVGKMPEILTGFEQAAGYTFSADQDALSGAGQIVRSLDHVRYGSGALALSYAAPGSMEEEGAAIFDADAPLKLSGARNLTFYAKGSPAKAVKINFAMSGGAIEQRSFNAGADWTLVTVSVPAGAQSIQGFSAAVAPGQKGEIYIDQIVAHYTEAQPDSTPPEILIAQPDPEGKTEAPAPDGDGAQQPEQTDQDGQTDKTDQADQTEPAEQPEQTEQTGDTETAASAPTEGDQTPEAPETDANPTDQPEQPGESGETPPLPDPEPDQPNQPAAPQALAATIRDSSSFLVPKDNIRVTYDGNALDFTYDSQTGALAAQLPQQTPGLHRLTITASDLFGNIGRASLTLGQPDPETPFEDMADHWGRDYAEFLRGKEVFSTDSQFMPQNNTTNEMAAALLSRYLGIDTASYQDVKLPYTDADKISDWALPHVKALYARGVMIGGADAKGRSVFQPQAPVTRAQVMTLLGRTLQRGYAYSPAGYEDKADIPSWALDHVNLMTSLGVITGYSGANVVKPLNSITRAEFASLLFKMY